MKQTTNLLSNKTIHRFQNQEAKRVWRMIACSTFVIAGLSVMVMQLTVQQIRSDTVKQYSRGDYPQQVANDNLRLRQELQAIQAKYQKQQELRCDRSPLTILQLLAGLQKEFQGSLTVESFDFSLNTVSQVQTTGSPAPNTGGRGPATPRLVGNKKNATGKLTLQVITDGTTRSSQFLQLLKDSGYFQEVKLNSPLSKLDRESSNLRFDVMCVF